MNAKAATAMLLWILGPTMGAAREPTVIEHAGDAASLQALLDSAPPYATIQCDPGRMLVVREPLTIAKPLTLRGLHARLPEHLGRTRILEVTADHVVLRDLDLTGNYATVSQDERAPLVAIHGSQFLVEDCRFRDGTKDGVNITPLPDTGDLVGGAVRNIEAERMGRDAVSISGGNRGARVRDVVVENVRLTVGYLRGSVEVSDGTDNISVRNVYAEECVYAVDVQDHRGESAANTNARIENVKAVGCRHILRTANSPRGHRGLALKHLTGRACLEPLVIRNTEDVTIEDLEVRDSPSDAMSPVQLTNCRNVVLQGLVIDDPKHAREPVEATRCEHVTTREEQ